MPESNSTLALLVLSSLAAGVVNSLAGGGTLLTFPSLFTALGPMVGGNHDLAAVLANGTSTTALLPGSIAGGWGYRRELREVGRWPWLLVVPSLVGGLIGTLLVTRLPARYFAIAVPWLILSATLLFALQPSLLKLSTRFRPAGPPDANRRSNAAYFGLVAGQFVIAIYGGYFGAGIGILMLSALGFMGVADIHHMNAVKSVLAACINALSVVVFAVEAKVVWPLAGVMAAAAIVGGYLGAHFGRRLPRPLVRWGVIVVGFGLAAKYFYQQFTAPS
jgi:uncharacterized membrane protein YfcA